MILNWVMIGLVIAGVILAAFGIFIGTRARMEDYAFILPIVLGVVCIATALALFIGRWVWHVIGPLL